MTPATPGVATVGVITLAAGATIGVATVINHRVGQVKILRFSVQLLIDMTTGVGVHDSHNFGFKIVPWGCIMKIQNFSLYFLG